MTVVFWDALGTLIDLQPIRAPFARAGAPHGLEAWIARILHLGAALTLAGDFVPFGALAETTLPSVLAQLGLPPADRGPLEALRGELRPHADAAEALDVLDAAGIGSWIVTNGGRESTESALARGGLDGRFRGIVSIDDVRRWKPDPAPYGEALRRADTAPADVWLVAAHGWDVHAALRLGLRAVWVDRLEHAWPLPGGQPAARASSLPEAARLVAADRGPAGATRP